MINLLIKIMGCVCKSKKKKRKINFHLVAHDHECFLTLSSHPAHNLVNRNLRQKRFWLTIWVSFKRKIDASIEALGDWLVLWKWKMVFGVLWTFVRPKPYSFIEFFQPQKYAVEVLNFTFMKLISIYFLLWGHIFFPPKIFMPRSPMNHSLPPKFSCLKVP